MLLKWWILRPIYVAPYKIILQTFKALHGLAPTYIQSMIQPRTVRPGLRSSGGMLYVPLTRLSSYGDRAFSNISPRRWNSLPQHQGHTWHLSIPTFSQNPSLQISLCRYRVKFSCCSLTSAFECSTDLVRFKNAVLLFLLLLLLLLL